MTYTEYNVDLELKNVEESGKETNIYYGSAAVMSPFRTAGITAS